MVHPLTTEATKDTGSTSSDGSSNAAQVDLGRVSRAADVFVNNSGSAQLTVEVSEDNSTWRQADTQTYSSATTDFKQYEFAYPHVRAFLNASTNTVEVVGRGL